jgi:N-acetyl-anhydromuramyl-L-alanine amidase AmpD
MATKLRIYPRVVVNHPSPNHSNRTARIDGAVVHSSEGKNRPGVSDLVGLGDWFGERKAEASSHVGTDADGTSARFVPDALKAWHVVSYNSRKLGVEQVGFASQGKWARAELLETARWLALWSRRHGFPLVESTERGVCRHSDLGAAGGGHHDPGPNYPLGFVLKWARRFRRLQTDRGVANHG